MAERVFLWIMVGVWLPYGIWCFVEPGYLAETAGVASTSPTGSTELRAMYGGLRMGIGALALAAALRRELAGAALLALAFLGGGLGLARITGAAVDDGWSFYTGMGMAFEFLILAASIALLRRRGGAAAAPAAG